MLDLQHLKYFQTVARLEHITQASIALRIAQPALSKTIRLLEEEVGAPLFLRSNRRIHLNQNGAILLRYTDLIEGYFQQLEQELAQCRKKQAATISILMKTNSTLLPGMLKQYCTEYPDVEVQLLVFNRDVDEQTVKSDFVIDASVPAHSSLSHTVLLEEEMVLAVPADHPLVGQRVPLQLFRQARFISMPPSYAVHHTVQKACQLAGFSPDIVVESSDPYTILAMISAQMGIAMIPELSWGYQEDPNVGLVYLEQPVPKNQLLLLWRSNAPCSANAQAFRAFAAQFFR